MKVRRVTEMFPWCGQARCIIALVIGQSALTALPAAAQGLGGSYVSHGVRILDEANSVAGERDSAASAEGSPRAKATRVPKAERPSANRERLVEGPFQDSPPERVTAFAPSAEPPEAALERAARARRVFLSASGASAGSGLEAAPTALVFELNAMRASLFGVGSDGAWRELLRVPFVLRGRPLTRGDEGLFLPLGLDEAPRRARKRRGATAAAGREIAVWSVSEPEEETAVRRSRRGHSKASGKTTRTRLSGVAALISDERGRGRVVFKGEDFARVAAFVVPLRTPLLLTDSLAAIGSEEIKGEDAHSYDVEGNVAEHLLATVERWRGAWEGANADAYAAFYAPGFRSLGRDRGEWLSQKERTARLEGTTGRRVRLDSTSVMRWRGATFVTFVQEYAGGQRHDLGLKVLRLESGEEGGPRIAGEHWRPVPGGRSMQASVEKRGAR